MNRVKSIAGGVAAVALGVTMVGVLVGPRMISAYQGQADLIDVPSPTPFEFTSPWPSPQPPFHDTVPNESPIPVDQLPTSTATPAPGGAATPPDTDSNGQPIPPAPAQPPAAPVIDHLTVDVVAVGGADGIDRFAVTVRTWPQDQVVSGACGSFKVQSPANGYPAIDDTYTGCTAAPPAWGYNHYLFAVTLAHTWAKGAPYTWSAQFTYQGVPVTARS